MCVQFGLLQQEKQWLHDTQRSHKESVAQFNIKTHDFRLQLQAFEQERRAAEAAVREAAQWRARAQRDRDNLREIEVSLHRASVCVCVCVNVCLCVTV